MENKEKLVSVSFEIKAMIPIDQAPGDSYMQKLSNWKDTIQKRLEKELVCWNAKTEIKCSNEAIINSD